MKTDSFYLAGEDVKREPFHYRACGLDGIFLLNGYEIQCHDGEEHVSITDIDGLHKAIGRHLVMQRKVLVPKELRFLRNTMGLTQAEMAKRLRNNSQSVARWEKGICEIPGAAEKLLRAVFLAEAITKDDIHSMSVEELTHLVRLLSEQLENLDRLDEYDEIAVPPAQFTLSERWSETPVEPIAA